MATRVSGVIPYADMMMLSVIVRGADSSMCGLLLFLLRSHGRLAELYP